MGWDCSSRMHFCFSKKQKQLIGEAQSSSNTEPQCFFFGASSAGSRDGSMFSDENRFRRGALLNWGSAELPSVTGIYHWCFLTACLYLPRPWSRSSRGCACIASQGQGFSDLLESIEKRSAQEEK